MEYSITPDGTMSGLIAEVSQDQIDDIIEGKHFYSKEVGILFSKIAISLQESVKKCVPDEWSIDLVTQYMTFMNKDFYEKSKHEKLKQSIQKTLELIQIQADRWFEEIIKNVTKDEVLILIYSLESNILAEKIQLKYFKPNKLSKYFLDFIDDILLMYKNRLKVINLEELVKESRAIPKDLFDIWLLNKKHLERVKKWDEVMNYLIEKEFLLNQDGNLYWDYVEGKKKNPFLAALLLIFREKKYIIIEDGKGKIYMNFLSKSFNVELNTPADFSLNSIKLWKNSREAALFNDIP